MPNWLSRMSLLKGSFSGASPKRRDRDSPRFPDWPDFPAITKEHVAGDARVYARRHDMIAGLPVRKQGWVAEIGVWRAGFSRNLVEDLVPRRFFAFDKFDGHLIHDWHGHTGHELFEGMTHRQFYEKEMSQYSDILTVVEGITEATLPRYTNMQFDLVYLDAAHDYESVKTDTTLAKRMVAEDGVLVFNDYIMRNTGSARPFGVIPVANDLIVNEGWQVIGFALDLWMHCDIAIRRV